MFFYALDLYEGQITPYFNNVESLEEYLLIEKDESCFDWMLVESEIDGKPGNPTKFKCAIDDCEFTSNWPNVPCNFHDEEYY